MLSMPPQNTVLDAAAAVQYGDLELVQTLATKDPATGCSCCRRRSSRCRPTRCCPARWSTSAPRCRPSPVTWSIDLPSVFNDYVLALIEASDDVLLVGSMDIPSIKNLKIGMQTLDLQAIAGPKLKLVLNHANAKVKLDVREIERVLGMSANFPSPTTSRCRIGERGPTGRRRRAEVAGVACARPHRRVAARTRPRCTEEGPARQVTTYGGR